MKKLLTLLIMVAFSATIFAQNDSTAKEPFANKKFTDYENFKGGTTSLDDLKGAQ